MIPKVKGYFRGIGIVEVLWKEVVSLLNCCLAAAITYNDAIHNFWVGRETGTVALEAKLIQQLTVIREAFLFEVFLDLQKAYYYLDWEMSLELLVVYGVGLRTLRLLQTYWERLTMVAKASRYFGRPFKGYRGVTQGGPMSPKIFNVVRDAIIRQRMSMVMPT